MKEEKSNKRENKHSKAAKDEETPSKEKKQEEKVVKIAKRENKPKADGETPLPKAPKSKPVAEPKPKKANEFVEVTRYKPAKTFPVDAAEPPKPTSQKNRSNAQPEPMLPVSRMNRQAPTNSPSPKPLVKENPKKVWTLPTDAQCHTVVTIETPPLFVGVSAANNPWNHKL